MCLASSATDLSTAVACYENALLTKTRKIELDNPALSDHDRPLNARGERDAPRMGAPLARACHRWSFT